jgi:hypothetical protein
VAPAFGLTRIPGPIRRSGQDSAFREARSLTFAPARAKLPQRTALDLARIEVRNA